MKFGFATRALGLVATAATALAISASTADAKKVRWKMHSAFGKNVAVIGPAGHRIADMVREMSGGDFDIKVFEPGALAGGYAYYDPVSQGAFEAGYGTPGANQGKNSMFAFASTWPFGPGALEFNAWIVNGLAVSPGRVIMPRGLSDETRNNLEKAGVTLIEIDYDRVQLNGGGIHCSTCPLIRDSV